MSSPTTNSFLFDVVLFLNRLTAGGTFLFAGLNKFRGGLGAWYDQFVGASPPWLPGWFGYPYGHAIPFLEIAVGVLLILGLFARLTTLVMVLMLASFTIALLAKQGFLGLGMHSNWVLLTLLLVLLFTGPGRFSADTILRRRAARRPETPVRG